MYDAITDVSGISVGHYTDLKNATGCTVILCENGALGGVDVRGSAPGTRETDLLRPTYRSQEVHAIVLSGGSAFGLDSATGVMRFLNERGFGVKVGHHRIPIVPAAILFDLNLINSDVRPGPDEGYKACLNAKPGYVEEGSVGAGTGATVGKVLGFKRAIKGGVGTASLNLGDGVIIGAIIAVNAIGSIVNPKSGEIIAGPRTKDGKSYHDTITLITDPNFKKPIPPTPTNTTIGVIATNINLTKEQVNKLASSGQNGLALAVRPAHTMLDGDCIFALATGEHKKVPNMVRLGAAATLCVSLAIISAIENAKGLGSIPSIKDLRI
jgi:L-aminopeptidase/D-esterase-like protein